MTNTKKERAMETGEIKHIKITELRPNPYQPQSRLKVAEETAEEFGRSILEKGLLQIPVCRAVDRGGASEFQMVDGWLRRSGFAWLAGHGHPEYAEMPVTLRPFTDQQMADMILVANQERKDLTPIDLAWYYKTYLAEFRKVTQADFARSLGVSQGEIANTIRLLELPEDVQEMIITCEITPTHGRSLLQLKESNLISDYANHAYANGWTVAQLDAVIKTYLDSQKPKLSIPESAVITEPVTEAKTQAQTDVTTKPSQETETAGGEEEDAGETEDSGTKSEKHGHSGTKPEKGEEKKTSKQKPAATKSGSPPPARPAAPVSVNWGRKLVIEEKKDHVLVSVMKAGGMPAFRKFEGGLMGLLDSPSMDMESLDMPLRLFLAELEAEWAKEKK